MKTASKRHPSAAHSNISSVPARLKKAIGELTALHELLLAGEVDPLILRDFRDALNRVRNTAWAAQQHAAHKDTDKGFKNVHSFLAGERIRAAYQLCGAIREDLQRTGIDVPSGPILELREATQALNQQLDRTIKS